MSLKETLAANKTAVVAETQEKKYYETLSARYYGDYRILGSNCLPIPKIGDMYTPETEDHIECLEYQVDQGRITKEIV